MLDDHGPDRRGDPELEAAARDLTYAVRAGDLPRAELAMSRTAAAIDQIPTLSEADTALLAVIECLRARLDLDAGHLGAARLSAATAIGLFRGAEGYLSSRVFVRVLVITAQIACRFGDILTARGRAREAVTIAGAALGATDPDTAIAWQVLAQSNSAAGDSVAAGAALRQSQASRDSNDTADQQTSSTYEDWLF